MKFLLASLFALFAISANAQQQPDLVVINARVRTMDRSHPAAEAVAVTGNKIIAVGSSAAIRKLAGPMTRIIDADGRLLLPGFNDSHVHFMAIGNTFSSLDLSNASSPSEVLSSIERYAHILPKGRWIVGGQWTHALWKGTDQPSRHTIDPVTPEHPVFLYNSDPNTALVNSLALKLAKVTKTTKDPPGGEIVRDEKGEPTGILKGKAVEAIRRLVPNDHSREWPAIAEAASRYAATLGVTSVHDTHSDEMASIYRELEKQGKLSTRIYDCVSLSAWARTKTPFENVPGSMVRTGCLKSFTDGEENWTPTLRADILAAEKAGIQVLVHAIGSAPNDIIAGIFGELPARNGIADRRYRIEHAERASESAMRQFAATGSIASVQPFLFAGTDASYYRSLIDNGVRIALGSDAPMTGFDPMLAIHAATSGPGSLTVEEAVRAYTEGSAFAEFQESVKGTITAGKLADMVILSDNIFEISRDRIPAVQVVYTIVDGKVVFIRNLRTEKL